MSPTVPFDLSLYLVTDSTPAILKGRDICDIVEQALKGGVTIVQYRDKTNDTAVQVETARRLHKVTQAYNVPLLINDRVDVAAAVGAEGVHLGQDDMFIKEARQVLREDAIIGISVSNTTEATEAMEVAPSYVGIGTMFSTPTKTNTKEINGTAGTQKILEHMVESGLGIGTVGIGGINLSNVQRVLYQSHAGKKGLDGVAIVSAIMAADDPEAAASQFKKRIKAQAPFATIPRAPREAEGAALLGEVPGVVRKVVNAHPLTHNMINYVVANFVANVILSMGASPIMSPYGNEAVDIAQYDGALVVNMGTLTSESIPNYLKAMISYNERGNPIVYDPVGAAATKFRREAVSQLMAGGYFDLIKGNEGEIKQVSGLLTLQRGVDSGPSSLSNEQKAALVKSVAQKQRNIVLMTGTVDYLSDGERVIAIENGHELLGQVTGTGCAVGSVSGCFLATHKSDKLLAVLSGLLMYEIAAENAASKDFVRGPGSFVPAFLDELYAIRQAALNGDDSWLVGRGKIRAIDTAPFHTRP